MGCGTATNCGAARDCRVTEACRVAGDRRVTRDRRAPRAGEPHVSSSHRRSSGPHGPSDSPTTLGCPRFVGPGRRQVSEHGSARSVVSPGIHARFAVLRTAGTRWGEGGIRPSRSRQLRAVECSGSSCPEEPSCPDKPPCPHASSNPTRTRGADRPLRPARVSRPASGRRSSSRTPRGSTRSWTSGPRGGRTHCVPRPARSPPAAGSPSSGPERPSP